MESSGGRTQVWRSRVGNILNKKIVFFQRYQCQVGDTAQPSRLGRQAAFQRANVLFEKLGPRFFWGLFLLCAWITVVARLYGRHGSSCGGGRRKGKANQSRHARTHTWATRNTICCLVCDGGAGGCVWYSWWCWLTFGAAIQHRMTVGWR